MKLWQATLVPGDEFPQLVSWFLFYPTAMPELKQNFHHFSGFDFRSTASIPFVRRYGHGNA